jgi:hypothetical protein
MMGVTKLIGLLVKGLGEAREAQRRKRIYIHGCE